MSRIGILLIGGSEPMGPLYEALRARGYVEGRNIQLVVRSAQGDANRLPQLATELVGGRVDVIVASLTPSAIAAKNATREIPIVMVDRKSRAAGRKRYGAVLHQRRVGL
jgi:putative ABC transport system substrate-binding protein